MGHHIDLTELQNIVSQNIDAGKLALAGGPMAGALIFRLIAGRSRVVNLTMAGAGAWFAVQELRGPMMSLMTQQFGYLQQLFNL